VMAGQISPWRLFTKEVLADPLLKSLLAGLPDKKADTIFGGIADQLKSHGLELIDSTLFIQDLLPAKGVLTSREPAFALWEDVYFGFDLAKGIGMLDIGQTVAVKEKAVVAVEALEGTDNLIRRAGKISRGGFTMVKVSKPKQDNRFDVPVVGLNTIRTLLAAKASCLAIEAGKTLFIDQKESIRLADRRGLVVVSV
jgi:UDP-2,3-diacylglucosamine hydrolase